MNIIIVLKRLPVKQFILIGLIIFKSLWWASAQAYFQQNVNYRIHATLNDIKHELSCFENVEYINNSPDTLKFLYFHLWPNAYSVNNTSLAKELLNRDGKSKLFKDPELRGYIDSLNFKVGGQSLKWSLQEGSPDICKILLAKFLYPGDSINITTPFRLIIPKGVTSRLGHLGQSYQISQWYPKPAVYDKSGWHQMPYLDQGEFYSEFGNYEVDITLPSNYVVGASGDLQNELEMNWLDELSRDSVWMKKTVREIEFFPESSKHLKTLNYSGINIHDFAWFADKRFHVLKGTIKLPDSNRDVTNMVLFTDQQSQLWQGALQYVNNAMLCFSKWIGDFPYNSFTAIQSALTAGTGMEYPGVTVIGTVYDAYTLDIVIAHELCHSWFYSTLGSDERRYPFMDESITSAYEERYKTGKYPEKKLWEVYSNNVRKAELFHIDKMSITRIEEMRWLIQARNNLEQPINLSAPDYSILNYGVIIYNKGAKAFNYLRAYLSDSIFDSAMHYYYSGWKSAHPQPKDLRNSFEYKTGKDLSWFFDDFIETTKRIDYKALSIKNQQFLVKNNGEIATPFVISGLMGDSICFEKWVEGFKGKRLFDIPNCNYSELKIDPEHTMPEFNRFNNNIKKSGIFNRADPFFLRLLFTIEDPEKRSMIYIPAINWTKEDKLMLGMTIYNGILIPKSVEYIVIPFYSFTNNRFAGFGRLLYNITPYDNLIRKAKITIEGTQFAAVGNQNYKKAMFGLDIYFRNRKMNNTLTHIVYGRYISASDILKIELLEKTNMTSYLQGGYIIEKTSIINPFRILTSFESNRSYLKTSLEFNYRYSYFGKNNGLDMRLFAGTMLKNNSSSPFHALAASGRSGRELYLYQGTFPDRFDPSLNSFWSRLMIISEGALISHINDSIGYSPWLGSLSLSSNLPGRAGKLPIKPFLNILLNGQSLERASKSQVFYELGLKVGYWNFFEIYAPLIVSGNIKLITPSFKDRIRIVFKLDYLFKITLNQIL